MDEVDALGEASGEEVAELPDVTYDGDNPEFDRSPDVPNIENGGVEPRELRGFNRSLRSLLLSLLTSSGPVDRLLDPSRRLEVDLDNAESLCLRTFIL
jgi:hypothetical protein